MRDLGALDELPKGVALEKSDVIALAAPILRAEEQKKRDALNSQRIWLALKVAGMLLVALVFGEPILAATQSARHAFVDGVEEKKHLARYAVECGSLFSAILVLITGVIDLLLCWVRLSVIISWVAPRNSSITKLHDPDPVARRRPGDGDGRDERLLDQRRADAPAFVLPGRASVETRSRG